MSSEIPPPSTKVAERLAVIVDAAERAALSVIDDAEKEAKRYLEEAQARADQIAAERLREAADMLEQQSSAAARPPLRPAAVEPPAVEELVERREQEPKSSGAAAARLLATQMAVSGSSRAEIEARLRNGFDVEDTDEILDAILGPEG
jgi:hypothetical protein